MYPYEQQNEESFGGVREEAQISREMARPEVAAMLNVGVTVATVAKRPVAPSNRHQGDKTTCF